MARRPGGELATRPLHFIWITDCSGSMQNDGKIQSLNEAIREAIPHMKDVADENPNARLLVRAVRFSDGAAWHDPEPCAIANYKWRDLKADGVTDLGAALKLVAESLKMPPMESRALPPVLVLISDGQPSDDYLEGLKALEAQPWGQKAIRLAIAIGEDADQDILQRFIGKPEPKVLQASTTELIAKHIKFVSTAVVKQASTPTAMVPTPIADVVKAKASTPAAPAAPAAKAPSSSPAMTPIVISIDPNSGTGGNNTPDTW